MLNSTVFSQTDRPGIYLESITLHGNYLRHFNFKSGEGLNVIEGFGGGAHIRVRLTHIIAIGFSGAYIISEIDQENAVDRWNWGFWERFYRNYVQDLQQRDPNYVATLTPIQRLQLIPIHLTAEFHLPAHIGVRPILSFGGSLYQYKRTLTLHERWEKYFPELNYTYAYEYDNHAENRAGTVFGLVGAMGGRLSLSHFVGIEAQARYHWIAPTESRQAYRNFPLKSFIDVSLGAVFVY